MVVPILLALYTYQTRIKIPRFDIYYALTVLVSVISIVIYTSAHYRQDILSTIIVSRNYLLILLIIPMCLIIIDEGKWNYFLEIANILATIWYFVVFVQLILYSTTGKLIIPYYFSKNVWIRNGRIRIGLPPYGQYMILYNIYMYFTTKSKKSLALFVFGLVCLILIDQTRAAQLITAAIFVLAWLFSNKKASTRMIAAFVVILGIVSLFAFGIDEMILESFSTTGEKGASTVARLNSLVYYLGCFFQNPFCGFGFTNNASIINGPTGASWPSDVGIVGQLAKIGLFVIPIYITIIVRLIRIMMNKNISHNCKLFVGLNLVYLIMSSGSLIILDSERSILTPIVLSSIDCFYREEMDGK
jgi:hypothetical protein